MKNIRIIFMGTPLIASDFLKILIEHNYNIVTVFTQPPRKQNRGLELKNSPVQDLAIKNNIKVRRLKFQNTKTFKSKTITVLFPVFPSGIMFKRVSNKCHFEIWRVCAHNDFNTYRYFLNLPSSI